MSKKLASVLILVVVVIEGCAVTSQKTCSRSLPYSLGEILFTDDFSDDLSNWLAEGTQPQLTKGRMELDTPVGTTIWFKPRLFGNVLIEYDVIVIDHKGTNDRVSDLNCFWMATDPANPDNLFAASRQRGGTFKNYDNLNLYYVGYGGNTNTTTRFRRYYNSNRVLLGEYTDSNHLIIPNHTYHIRLVVLDNVVEYYIDGERLFHYYDAEPFREGHFGLRTVKNHLAMDNFRVVRIRQNED
jgi:hypothetical protein